MASVPLLYLLARRIINGSTAVIASLLLAVASVHIISAGIIRDITLGLFFLLGCYVFVRIIDKEQAGTTVGLFERIGYAVFTLAALFTTYFSAPILLILK